MLTKPLFVAFALACLTMTASAETVACPPTATPAACAENQAIHDAYLAGSYIGPNPVFLAGAVDPRSYLGSDPDANVRLALRRQTIDGGGSGDKK